MSASHQSGSSKAPLPAASLEHDDYADELARAQRLLFWVTLVWIAFGLLDWMVVTWLSPGRLWVYYGLRLIGLVPLSILMARLRRSPPPSRPLLVTWVTACHCGAAALIGLMCVEYDGITSPYTAGVVLVLMSRGALLATHWRRAMVQHSLILISHPLALVSSTLWSERVRQQLEDPVALARFGEFLFYLVGGWVIVTLTSHVTWQLRGELSEARQRVGRYRLQRLIGRGGMGEVHEAFDTALKRPIALKLLASLRNTPEDIARFQREVRATSELSHPNTVRVFDSGVTHEGRWYYTMELLEGQSLRTLVDDVGPLPASRVASIVAQTASALHEAHSRGIIHRDVKPDNIFITPVSSGDHVKLLDFGIASIATHRTYGTMTRPDWVGGTPLYMSPEVIRGERVLPSSDVYSLGATAYFAATGHAPFEGDSVAEILNGHLNAPVVSPSERLHGSRLPERLDQALMRCLAKEPEQRFQSAEALAAALLEPGTTPLPELPDTTPWVPSVVADATETLEVQSDRL